jgi:hypothetical protein
MRLKFRAERKPQNLQNHSTNQSLLSIKRAFDGMKRNYGAPDRRHSTPVSMIDSQQIMLNQTICIEAELRRNAGLIYAKTTPPR